jgi:flagellar hook-length control protein FliK
VSPAGVRAVVSAIRPPSTDAPLGGDALDEAGASRPRAAGSRPAGHNAEPSVDTTAAVEVPPSRPPDPLERAATLVSPAGVRAVVSAIRMSAAQGGMELRLQLHPESLGDVRVHVRWAGGALTARLEAGTSAAREALAGGLQTLRTALQEQGIPVDRLQVGMRLDLHDRSQGQGPGREQGADASSATPAVPLLPAREAPATPAGLLDIRI